jgi:hypothetical protein
LVVSSRPDIANIGIILAAALTPRAGAEWGPDTGVKPEQFIQFKEGGVAGHGGRNRFGGRYAFVGDARRSWVRKGRPLS